MFVRSLFVAGLMIGGAALWSGLGYYLTPFAERPFSPLDGLFASTGLIGHGFGVVGSLMIIVGVGLYAARKRVPFLAGVGKLRDWLHFHIFLCLLGPFLIVLHTTFKVSGLVAISFWSMVLVVSSGLFGRYVYVWIPKTMNGRFLGAEEVRDQMSRLLQEAGSQVSLTEERLHEILRGVPQTARVAQPVAGGSGHEAGIAPTRARIELTGAGIAPNEARIELTGAARSVVALFSEGDSGSSTPASPPSSASPPASGSPPASRSAPTDEGIPTDRKKDRRASARPGPDRRRTSRNRLGIGEAVVASLRHKLGRRKERARYDRELAAARVEEPTRSRIVEHLETESRIEQQLRMLQPFQRAFRYWHAFHLPLAIVMFVVLLGHVAVAAAFGYTWVFWN